MSTTNDDSGEKETIPSWVTRLVDEVNGEDVNFLFHKRLTASDVNPQQSRLLMPLSFVIDTLLPVLVTEGEILAIGLANINVNGEGHENEKKKKKSSTAGVTTTKTKREKQTFAPGLKIKAYTRDNIGNFFNLNMILWASSNSSVINGKDWLNLVRSQEFTMGTQVGVWSFRTIQEEEQEGDLNLVIGKDEVNGSE